MFTIKTTKDYKEAAYFIFMYNYLTNKCIRRLSIIESKTGTVKCYDKEKGFGFILPDNGLEELFVHFSSVYNSNSLKVGQEVSYIEYKGHKGPQAEYVMLL